MINVDWPLYRTCNSTSKWNVFLSILIIEYGYSISWWLRTAGRCPARRNSRNRIHNASVHRTPRTDHDIQSKCCFRDHLCRWASISISHDNDVLSCLQPGIQDACDNRSHLEDLDCRRMSFYGLLASVLGALSSGLMQTNESLLRKVWGKSGSSGSISGLLCRSSGIVRWSSRNEQESNLGKW